MTWGIPTSLFLQIHVALSLIGIVTGLVVLYGLLIGRHYGGWTALFLGSLVLTSATGFPLEPLGFDPAHAVGVISLVLLALAIAALYGFRLAGAWRWIYIGGATAALYLDSFVGVAQAFQKLPFLQPLQAQPPFVVTQVAVLVLFIALGILAAIRFHPGSEARA
jgi:hypothetical protein